MRKTTLAATLAVLLVATALGVRAWAAANVPNGLTYSGLLRNGGTPEAGVHPHDFVFELHDGSGVICTDTRTGLSITNGRFDVAGLFATACTLDTFLSTKPSLAIRLTVDGTLLNPPQPIGTVPYAARARVAESVEGGPRTAWVSFNGLAASCPGGVCPIFDSVNATSVQRLSEGTYRITWAAPFTNTTYVVTGACQRSDSPASLMFQIGRETIAYPFTTTTAQVGCGNYNGLALDSGLVNVTAIGH